MNTQGAPKPIVIRLPYDKYHFQDVEEAVRQYLADDERINDGKVAEGPDSLYEVRSYSEVILRYPTVYIVYDREEGVQNKGYKVYVGETNNIRSRTRQHIEIDPKNREDWESLVHVLAEHPERVFQFVIGDEHFNKSLTLDVENRLMGYMQSVDAVDRVMNRRANAQDRYFTSDEFDDIFSQAWSQLHEYDPVLFPDERLIRDSALFKASPFQKLSEEQIEAEDAVLSVLEPLVKSRAQLDADCQPGDFYQSWIDSDAVANTKVIVVQGMSGTGKTVLLSHLYYRICNDYGIYGDQHDSQGNTLFDDGHRHVQRRSYVIVNQDEQVNVYNQMATKLGLQGKPGQSVLKAAQFINRFSKQKRSTGRGIVDQPSGQADVVLVDEAHLLMTQGGQSYSGDNQLHDILRRTKVAIVVFDPEQVLRSSQYVDADERHLLGLMDENDDETSDDIVSNNKVVTTFKGDTYDVYRIKLRRQMRMQASEETCAWLDALTAKDGGTISKLPPDTSPHPYEIKVFDSPSELYEAIRNKEMGKRVNDDSSGLCRVLATYDWKYSAKPKDSQDPNQFWNVELHRDCNGVWVMGPEPESSGEIRNDDCAFRHPWNYQLYRTESNRAQNKDKSAWAEIPFTINEIGSIFTIQGFDLNYAGVIIGPSVQYRNGRIVFNPEISQNHLATRNRSKEAVDPVDNLRHELNVLLKRGVYGLYLFAVDEPLQKRLKECVLDF